MVIDSRHQSFDSTNNSVLILLSSSQAESWSGLLNFFQLKAINRKIAPVLLMLTFNCRVFVMLVPSNCRQSRVFVENKFEELH